MARKTLFRINNNAEFLTVLGIFSAIVLLNMLTLAEPTNLLVTIPQYVIVIALIAGGDYKNATLLHFSFFILSLSIQKTLGLMESQSVPLYNYGSMKLIGPVRLSYLINIVLVIICASKGLKPRKDIAFYKLFKTFLYISGIATVVGFLGLVVHPYYTFSGFISPVVYMFVVLSTCYVLLCLATDDFIKSCYYIALLATMAGVFASYISYTFFNISTSYSVYDIFYCADCMWFAAILVAGVLSIKEKTPLYLSLIILFLIYMNVMEGKTVFNLAFAMGCLLYYVFFDKQSIAHHRIASYTLRPLLIVGSFLIITRMTLSNDSMSLYKIQSALSIFSSNVDDIANSPYIRIASLQNVIYEGFRNPFILIFGNGYGGYFTDNLNLFAGFDISVSGWTEDVARTGRFPNGHDTMVNVPFYNGLIGTFLIIKICYLYIKRIKFNFMNSVAFMWILLMFYFNTIFAVMGCFFLMGAEYDVNGYTIKSFAPRVLEK